MAHTLLAHSVDEIYKMNKLLSNLPSLHMHNCLMQVKHRPVLVLVQLQLDSVAGRVWRKAPRNHLLSKDYSHKQICNVSYNYQKVPIHNIFDSRLNRWNGYIYCLSSILELNLGPDETFFWDPVFPDLLKSDVATRL